MAAGGATLTSFPMAHCGECGKQVLTALSFDGDSRQRHCAHCDSPITTNVEWIETAELEEHGYVIGRPKPSTKGCGGGCGSGCATHRP